MDPLSLDCRISPSDDVVFREFEGEAIVLDTASGIYFGLDPVGTRIWQLITSDCDLRTVFDTVLAEYEVSPQQLERDLLALITELTDRGLVTPR